MKKIIRLTESDLHKIVKESVSKILREAYNFDDDDDIDNESSLHKKIKSNGKKKSKRKYNSYIDDL